VKPEDFDLLSGLLKERSGLALSKEKTYLLESRLLPIARKRGMAGLDDLVAAVRLKKEEPLLRDITEAMMTNESFFFRDGKPFSRFSDFIIPKLAEVRAPTRRIRVWCAACSTGQEPYSLAICLHEQKKYLKDWRVEIVATDISGGVLEKAKAGVYSQFEVQRGLPIKHLVKYFEKVGEMWQIDASIRAMVNYRELNLLSDFTNLGAFDVIFCRNVLIYFESNLKTQILNNISRMMPNDGYLFLGGAETVLGLGTKFGAVPGERGIYVLAGETAH
jgi:chemotaxis protein methyltransferase CheR